MTGMKLQRGPGGAVYSSYASRRVRTMLRMAKTARDASSRARRPLIRARSLFKRRRDDVLVSRTVRAFRTNAGRSAEKEWEDEKAGIMNWSFPYKLVQHVYVRMICDLIAIFKRYANENRNIHFGSIYVSLNVERKFISRVYEKAWKREHLFTYAYK